MRRLALPALAVVLGLGSAVVAPRAASAKPEQPRTGPLERAIVENAVPISPGVAVRPPMTATVHSKPAPSPGWRWPLVGRITQLFGQSLTVYGYHQGIDIDGQTGDPVVAAHSGRVTVAGDIGGCGGRQVQIEAGSGILTIYHHFSAVEVEVGEEVSAGERIGRVGETGCALGSHLHFAVQVDGTYVDPLRYLPKR